MARSPLGLVFALSSMQVILASRGFPQMQAFANSKPRFCDNTSVRHPVVINGCRRYTPSHLLIYIHAHPSRKSSERSVWMSATCQAKQKFWPHPADERGRQPGWGRDLLSRHSGGVHHLNGRKSCSRVAVKSMPDTETGIHAGRVRCAVGPGGGGRNN
jgi:hypothetical protein